MPRLVVMRRSLVIAVAWITFMIRGPVGSTLVRGAEPTVTGIAAVHRHGQTFVTWNEAARGEAAAEVRYSLYRSDEPITAENLNRAEVCYHGVLYNSAKLYGAAFNQKDRLDESKPYTILEEKGKPLPAWSGLAVRTALRKGRGYYAVVATDLKLQPLTNVVPGESATTRAVDEEPAPIEPIKLYDSKERATYVAQTSITGTKHLPLSLRLGGSDARGGGAGAWGDYYLFFGTPDMGYRDGLAGVFSVQENRDKTENRLQIVVRDAVEHPNGRQAMETYWFGYACVPTGATHAEPRVYPFTERQLLWIVDWTAKRYAADPMRITVGGNSSGAVGSFNVGWRHPELFAAAYPVSGRVRRVPAVVLSGKYDRFHPFTMADGQTPYLDYVDGPKFASERHDDLPFLGWASGRNDGYATWPEQIDLVRDLTANHHGFAFAWNNGGHGDGGKAMRVITQFYPPEKFARDRSYPAFGNSSFDQKMGPGDVTLGDLEGGINLGFVWDEVIDEPGMWSARLANELADRDVTVDVTARRCQRFKLRPGTKVKWVSSSGETGLLDSDAFGLVTVPQLRLAAKRKTVLTLSATP